MLRAAVHPAFRGLVANFGARLLVPLEMETALDILDQMPLVDDAGEPAPWLTTWLKRWTEVDEDAAIAWLRQAVADHEPSVQHAWWKQMVLLLPPGDGRARAIETWAGG